MNTHEIPQNVTAYEGRIVGKFTARQFTYLAIGGIIIFLLFSTPLGTIYRIIFVSATLMLTILFALVAFEERGADVWLLLFTRAVGFPTLRIWKKSEAPPAVLLASFKVERKPPEIIPKTRSELEKFLSAYSQSKTLENLTEEERSFLAKLPKI